MFQRAPPRVLLLTVAIAALMPMSVGAQDANNPAEHHSAEHPYYTHMLGLFLGAAHEDFGRRDNGFVLGIEYEYRLGPRFGIGTILEHT